VDNNKSKNPVPHILVIGDIMLDHYYYGSSNRLSPEAPVPVVLKNDEKFLLGGAGNVCMNLKSLGSKVTLVSIIGDDSTGLKIKQVCKEHNIYTKFLTISSRKTPLKTRVIVNKQQILRLDDESNTNINMSSKNTLLKSIKEILPKVDIVIFSDYNKGINSILPDAIKIARNQRLKIIIDPKTTAIDSYSNAFLLSPNLNEFKAMIGCDVAGQDLFKKGRILLKRLKLDALLITMGEDGMALISGNKKSDLVIKASKKQVYDVTGAGDTVIASLAYFLASGKDLKTATYLSNIAAGVVVSKPGTSLTTIDEIFSQSRVYDSESTPKKIDSEENIIDFLHKEKSFGKKIVFTNGCFDILHSGHLKLLKEAKNLGDYLCVALNSDSSVRKLKGSTRPINNQIDRASLLSSLEMIDFIIIFNETTPLNLIKKIKPNYLVKGRDYRINEIVGAKFIKENGGEIHLVSLEKGKSSTSILERFAK